MAKLPAPWKMIRSQDTDRGTVEMWHGVFGKGRARLESWKFYLGETQIDYASIASDAEENWRRCVNGRGRLEATV